ncbi:MAG: hypothetical protein ABR512_03055 [Desulfopila sp.]
MQQPSSYRNIIETKIEEWHQRLAKLELRATKESAGSREKIRTKLDTLSTAVNSAIIELRSLEGQETDRNTIEIKDKILQVFDAIDRDLVDYEDKTPFML